MRPNQAFAKGYRAHDVHVTATGAHRGAWLAWVKDEKRQDGKRILFSSNAYGAVYEAADWKGQLRELEEKHGTPEAMNAKSLAKNPTKPANKG